MKAFNKVPVKYKGQIIGYTDEKGYVQIEDKETWNKILGDMSQTIYISSRAKGKINTNGRIIQEEPISYDIETLTQDDAWIKQRDDREWNRCFNDGTLVILNEEWMNDREKLQYADIIGRVGKVLHCSSDLHAYGRGSLHQHHIEWPGKKITGIHDGTYDEKSLAPASAILENFHEIYLKDLQNAFPGKTIKFGRGDRILIDNQIIPGVLCTPPRVPYKLNLKYIVDLIKTLIKKDM